MKHMCPESPRIICQLRQFGQIGPYEQHLSRCGLCREAIKIHHILRSYQPPEIPLPLRHMSGIRWRILIRKQEKQVEKAALPLNMVSRLFVMLTVVFFMVGGSLAILRFYEKIRVSIVSLFGPTLKSFPLGHPPAILMAAAGVILLTLMVLLTEFVTSD